MTAFNIFGLIMALSASLFLLSCAVSIVYGTIIDYKRDGFHPDMFLNVVCAWVLFIFSLAPGFFVWYVINI
jgi:hypothetical protein